MLRSREQVNERTKRVFLHNASIFLYMLAANMIN